MRSILALACLVLLPVAQAGTLMTSEVTNHQDNSVTHQDMKVDNNQLRVDSLRKNGKTNTVIFKNHALYIVNNEERTYSVIDEATMARLGDTMAGMKAQMTAQMANLPPEQRAMVEKMMPGAGAAAAPPPPRAEFKRTSRSETVAGIRCEVWEGTTSGQKSEELCVAPKGAVAGAGDMFAALRSFSETMLKMSNTMGFGKKIAAQNPWTNLDRIDGIPLAQRHFEGATITEEMKVTSVRSATVPAAAFEMPAGYQKKDMMGGMGHM